METTTFTNGPWELRPNDMGGLSTLIYPTESEYPVAEVTGYYSSAGQTLANAKLVAAAPELFKALQQAIAYIDGERTAVDALANARAIIAKATQ